MILVRTNTCLTCGETFTKPHNPNRVYRFCSVACSTSNKDKRQRHSEVMRGKVAWNRGLPGRQPWHNTTGLNTGDPWNQGETGLYSAETRKKMGAKNVGVPPPNKGQPMSDAQREKLRAAKLGKKGADCNAWQGGKTAEQTLIRSSAEGKAWKRAVLERDHFTCQVCGQVGGKLHVDHIKPFAYFPALRFDPTNGRTLCTDCHRATDTYAGKAVRHRPIADADEM
jgi:HNH endonuclease